jgi:hypothetical protein
MFLGWLFTGAVVGWILSAAGRPWRRSSIPLLTEKEKASQPLHRRPGGGFAAATVLLFLAATFASMTDHAAVSNWLLCIKSIFIGSRIQTFFSGVVMGVFAEYNKSIFAHLFYRGSNVIIGDKEEKDSKSNNDARAGGVRSIAIIALAAAIVFAIRPDFFDYLRSLRFGGFEATFADRTPLTLRDAHLNLRDYRESVALTQYEDFREEFLSENSKRGLARTLTMDRDLKTEAGEITAELFELYVGPVITSVLCLREVNALSTASRDYDLVAYATIWQDFLLKIRADSAAITTDAVDRLLMNLRERASSIAQKTYTLAPQCMDRKIEPTLKALIGIEHARVANDSNLIEPTTEKLAAGHIFDHFQAARRIMKSKGFDKPEILALTVFEPYLTGAVADLVALTSGDREKTDFLVKMLDGFPMLDDFVSPGTVNLFYQISDSWLNNIGPLPLDSIRAAVEYATRGADLTMSRSRARLEELEIPAEAANGTKAHVRGGAKPGDIEKEEVDDGNVKQNKPAIDDKIKVTEVFDVYLRNSFATLTAETDLYVQRALSNEEIPESHHQSWVKSTSRLLAMLQVKLKAPSVELDGVPRFELDEFTKARLDHAKIEIDPDFLLQADLAAALSLVLLEASNGNRSTARSCDEALFFLNNATTLVEPTKHDNDLSVAQARRLQQLIAVVGSRVGSSCNWTYKNS